jgi:hypothetical protein
VVEGLLPLHEVAQREFVARCGRAEAAGFERRGVERVNLCDFGDEGAVDGILLRVVRNEGVVELAREAFEQDTVRVRAVAERFGNRDARAVELLENRVLAA